MKILIPAAILSFIVCSCEQKIIYTERPIKNSKGLHIADSIFANGTINKIRFIDTSYAIDSISFDYWDSDSRRLKSVRTYKSDRMIFANVFYHENGNIRKYLFVDEDNNRYFYERTYNEAGVHVKTIGKIFFQGYVAGINENLEVKKGTPVGYKIYYPSPPDCEVKLFVKNDDSSRYDVFSKSKFIDFLQTTSNDNVQIGSFKVNIAMELTNKRNQLKEFYERPFIYKVVE